MNGLHIMNEQELKDLYLNNYKRKTFQWELWSFCNQKCVFCYLGADNKDTRAERQMKSLMDFEKSIDNLDYTLYNNISIIGGEFFQGEFHTPEIKEKFLSIMKKIGQLYEDKKIGSCWLTCTLTRKEQDGLYDLLDYFKKNKIFIPNKKYTASGLWLCTSYDTKGRFHTQEQKDNWNYHMLNISKNYKFVKLNTTIILTGHFINEYLNNKIHLGKFSKKYNTTLFFKQPGLGTQFEVRKSDFDFINDLEKSLTKYKEKWLINKRKANEFYKFDFFPAQEEFKKLLIKIKAEEPEFYNRLFNIRYRADEVHRNKNEAQNDRTDIRFKDAFNETNETNNVLNDCKHLFSYACYVDNNNCCMCDKNNIDELC